MEDVCLQWLLPSTFQTNEMVSIIKKHQKEPNRDCFYHTHPPQECYVNVICDTVNIFSICLEVFAKRGDSKFEWKRRE